MFPERGLTKRQWYAGMALQGICANPDISKNLAKKNIVEQEHREIGARSAFEFADAMIHYEAKEQR